MKLSSISIVLWFIHSFITFISLLVILLTANEGNDSWIGIVIVVAEVDQRITQLKDDYDNSQREINFLNSVIVDMQKKVDDLKVQLEISQASLLGQNITERNM